VGYNYSWGNTWIKDHDEIGAQVSKPVVLEEYGAQGKHYRHGAAVAGGCGGRYGNCNDSFWQSGTALPSGTNITDSYTIE
jgi:mannan endo-1,4-beta-mannosidase